MRKKILRKKTHWSLSAAIKGKVKNAVKYINRFEESMADYAKVKECDIIICGHIHCATIEKYKNIDYINIGDFVESRTVLVEHLDGNLELLKFSNMEKGNLQSFAVLNTHEKQEKKVD